MAEDSGGSESDVGKSAEGTVEAGTPTVPGTLSGRSDVSDVLSSSSGSPDARLGTLTEEEAEVSDSSASVSVAAETSVLVCCVSRGTPLLAGTAVSCRVVCAFGADTA